MVGRQIVEKGQREKRYVFKTKEKVGIKNVTGLVDNILEGGPPAVQGYVDVHVRNICAIDVEFGDRMPDRVVANRTSKQAPVAQLGYWRGAGIPQEATALILHQ